jgi:hypothetical protein
MTPSSASTRLWTTFALLLSMSLPGSSLSAQERVSVDSAVIRQCATDARKADQYDELRDACERLREEIWGLRAMHTQAVQERDTLRVQVQALEARWSPLTWYMLGLATAAAVALGVLVSL